MPDEGIAKSESLLSVRNLSVEFRTQDGIVKAVNDVSLELPAGKTLGLVGESGSGKSVTSLAIMQLIQSPPGSITQGEVLLEGQDLLKLKESQLRQLRGDQLSMIFQEPMTSLNPVFRVGTQIAEVLRLHKRMGRKQAMERAVDLLDQVGIPDPSRKVKAYPHELSGGQKQRVMIAMAIACEPKLLIADEPTTALDVTIQKQVLELLAELQQNLNMGLLFITHDLGVIADIADEVAVMYRSRIVESGTTQTIFRAAQHPYTKGLIACRPRLGGNPRRLLTVADFMDEDGTEKTVPADKLAAQPRRDTPLDEESAPLLKVRDLATHFPIGGGFFSRASGYVKAVDGVSFDVRRGETLGLVGESGCGKTTLGRSILRLVEPTAGSVEYDGTALLDLDVQAMRSMRKRMQIVFQDPYSSLNPRMTIADTLTEPLKVHRLGNSRSERRDKAAALMELVQLSPHLLGRYPHEFSGGQRQRICIARALAADPEFVVCDESVSALDVSVQAQILNLLLDLQEQLGLTYIFISHDLSVVNFVSDRVGVMSEGRLLELDQAREIYENPQNEYTRKLLSAIPKGLE